MTSRLGHPQKKTAMFGDESQIRENFVYLPGSYLPQIVLSGAANNNAKGGLAVQERSFSKISKIARLEDCRRHQG
jgi:hypothetical protein